MTQASRPTKVARFLVMTGAAFVLATFVAGTVRFSTLLETITSSPNVFEWKGPAGFRIGMSPACGDHPCWAESDVSGEGWDAVDVPHAYLKERLAGAAAAGAGRPDSSARNSNAPAADPVTGAPAAPRAYYRFLVDIPAALAATHEAVAFSPNWVVHRRYDVYVDGRWVLTGNGTTATGDIVYQKVVIPLPESAVAAGQALVTVVGAIGPQDLGIQHLGKILVGPAATLARLHVQSEFAMGSFYLLFTAAEGAVFVFFGVIFLLTRTRRGFGAFVGYAFLTTVTHLVVGNFLEGLLPLGTRVWLYFLVKAGATALLALVLGAQLWNGRWPRAWTIAAVAPFALSLALLLDFSFGTHAAKIALMHDAANSGLLAVVALYLGLALRYRARARGDVAWFAAAYAAFLVWSFFLRKQQDFDYRPLADLAFFYVVAWMTMSSFGVTQARVAALDHNFRRLHGVFARLTGRRVATHLTVRGAADERAQRDATVMVVDLRYTQRLLATAGVEPTLALVDRFLALATDAVEAHGGDVVKIMGDKVLAVWGLTQPDPLARSRAAACGVALRLAVVAENAKRAPSAPPMAWASGIASGALIVGRIGAGDRSDYGVFGAPVGRAFTLAEAARDAGFDVVLDAATASTLATDALVQPLDAETDAEDAAAALIGLLDDGRWTFGDRRWQMRFGDRAQGGRVFDAGANQDTFVPAAQGARDAA